MPVKARRRCASGMAGRAPTMLLLAVLAALAAVPAGAARDLRVRRACSTCHRCWVLRAAAPATSVLAKLCGVFGSPQPPEEEKPLDKVKEPKERRKGRELER